MLLGLQLKVTEYVLDESDQLMPMNRLHGENTVTGKYVTFSVLWSSKTKIPLMLNKRKNVKRFRGILSLFVLFCFFSITRCEKDKVMAIADNFLSRL